VKTIRAQCTACGKDMRFVEGDIIHGEKWYHKDCVKQATSLRIPDSTQKARIT